MRHYYVYKTINTNNEMCYIGSHYGKLTDSYFGSGLAISRAIKKYGKSAFKKEILEIVDNKERLLEREAFWLKKFNCANNPLFYNLTNVAGSGFMSDGKTKEERDIIREKQEIGRRAKREQTIQKMLQTKQNWTKEQKEHLSRSISESLKNLPKWKKKRKSKMISKKNKERFKNMSLSQKEEYSAKMKQVRAKRLITEEQKQKTSVTLKNTLKNLPQTAKNLRIKHLGNIVRGKKWCNNGVRNYRKTPEQIAVLNYKLGKM